MNIRSVSRFSAGHIISPIPREVTETQVWPMKCTWTVSLTWNVPDEQIHNWAVCSHMLRCSFGSTAVFNESDPRCGWLFSRSCVTFQFSYFFLCSQITSIEVLYAVVIPIHRWRVQACVESMDNDHADLEYMHILYKVIDFEILVSMYSLTLYIGKFTVAFTTVQLMVNPGDRFEVIACWVSMTFSNLDSNWP
jgi:hypothetical protein